MFHCLRKATCVAAAIFLTIQLPAQNKYSSQLNVISENDNYTFRKKDRYYTNGLLIRYAKLLNSPPGKVKRIWTTEVGQKIYNPYRHDQHFQRTMDRPFTGFLYLKSGITRISARDNIFRWSVLTGLIGEAALGKEVQRWHHENFNLPYPYGWETQLKSELGLNTQFTYYHHLLQPTQNKRVTEALAKFDIMAGSLFTGAAGGFLFKAGIFDHAGNSAQWDARVQTSGNSVFKKHYELFLYVEPAVHYQLYNATVQGGLFTRNKDQYTTGIQPFYYSHNIGLMYAEGRWTAGFSYAYKTKEAITMRTDERYGSIQLGYRW